MPKTRHQDLNLPKLPTTGGGNKTTGLYYHLLQIL